MKNRLKSGNFVESSCSINSGFVEEFKQRF